MGLYVAACQPRIVKKHLRGTALLVDPVHVMLMVVRLGSLRGASPYLLVVPAMITGITLTIAYNQRFALGIGSYLIVTGIVIIPEAPDALALLLTAGTGMSVAILAMRDVRKRSRLLEICCLSALAVLLVTWIVGLWRERPLGVTSPLTAPGARAGRWSVGSADAGHLAGDRASVPHGHEHDPAGLRRRHAPPASTSGRGGSGHLQSQLADRHAGRGRRRQHRRQWFAVPRGQLLSRHRQAQQAALFHREPGRLIQSAQGTGPHHEPHDHHRSCQGRFGTGPSVSSAACASPVHRHASRHHTGRLFLPRSSQGRPGRP